MAEKTESKYGVISRASVWQAVSTGKPLTDVSQSFRGGGGGGGVIAVAKTSRDRLTMVPVGVSVFVGGGSKEVACSMVEVAYGSGAVPSATFRPALGFELKDVKNVSPNSMRSAGYMEGMSVRIYMTYGHKGLVGKKSKVGSGVNKFKIFDGYISGIGGERSTASSVSAGMTVQCVHRAWCIASLPPVSRIFTVGATVGTLDTYLKAQNPLPGSTDATNAAAATAMAVDLITNTPNLFEGMRRYLAAIAASEGKNEAGVRSDIDQAALAFLSGRLEIASNLSFDGDIDMGATARSRAAAAISSTLATQFLTSTALDMILAHVASLYARACWTCDGMYLMGETGFFKQHELEIDSSCIFTLKKSQMVNPRKVAGVALVNDYLGCDRTKDGDNAAGGSPMTRMVMWPPQNDAQAAGSTVASMAAEMRKSMADAYASWGNDMAGAGAGMYLTVGPPTWAKGVFAASTPDVSSGSVEFVRRQETSDLFPSGSPAERAKNAKTGNEEKELWQRLQDCIARAEFGHRVWRGTSLTMTTPFIPDIAIGQRVCVNLNAGGSSKAGNPDVSLFGSNVMHGVVEEVSLHVEPGVFYMDVKLEMLRTASDNKLYGLAAHPLFPGVSAYDTKPIFTVAS